MEDVLSDMKIRPSCRLNILLSEIFVKQTCETLNETCLKYKQKLSIVPVKRVKWGMVWASIAYFQSLWLWNSNEFTTENQECFSTNIYEETRTNVFL